MGSCCSKEEELFPRVVTKDPEAKWSHQLTAAQAQPQLQDKRPRPPPLSADLIPKDEGDVQMDLKVTNLTGQVVIRKPGTIKGNQFVIDSCTDCDFFLCDEMDSAMVDDCKNCRFFFGPTTGAVFLRTTKDSSVVVASQQLRLRDCKDLQMLVYCPGQPSIESCSRIGLGCFEYFYFDLPSQFGKVKFSIYNNQWSNVHDFTPGKGSYTLLDPSIKSKDLLKPLTQEWEIGAEHPPESEFVPLTWGARRLPDGGEFALAIWFPNTHGPCQDFLHEVHHNHSELTLIEARERMIDLEVGKACFASGVTIDRKTIEKVLSGPVIVTALYGDRAVSKVSRLTDPEQTKGNVFVAPNEEQSKAVGGKLLMAVEALLKFE